MSKGGCFTPLQEILYPRLHAVVRCKGGGGSGVVVRPPTQARIQVFLGGDRKHPLRLSAIFFLLVDLPRALQQFGSAPEIPVRNPPF